MLSMNENYERIYEDTLLKLKNGQRPQVKLTPELITELKQIWENTLALKVNSAQQNETIKKILCILDHTQNSTSELNHLFIKTLQEIKDQELIIYTLSASQKHVVTDGLKSGRMIEMEYFDALKSLLKIKNPEIVEWTLRTIETMGPLSLRFKKEVLASRPGLMKFFNPHLRASSQLIDYLEKEWIRMLG